MRLAAILLLALSCVQFAHADTPYRIDLRPDMPALSDPGVPALWDQVPDADWVKPGASIEPTSAYHWLAEPGGPFTARIRATSPSKADRAILTVWDWENRPVAQTKLAVPSSSDVQFAVTGRGTYLLTLDGFLGDKCSYRLMRSFCVCPSNTARRKQWAVDEFFVGTCSFPARQTWGNKFGPAYPPGLTPEQSWRTDLDMIDRMGLQVVRLDVPTTATQGEHNWVDADLMDPIISAYASRGLKLDLQLWGPAPILPKYGNPPDAWRYPRREGPLRQYIREATKRYAKYARFIEIWNEPDNLDFWRGTPEEFVAQHKWAVEEIRRIAPKATITNGGYCLVKPEWTPIFASALKGTIDEVAYHSHGDLPSVRKVFDQIVRIHKDAGYASPKFINTEMGYAAWRLDQERYEATTAVQKLVYYWAHGNKGALLYVSRDVGGPRIRTDDADWGFVDYFMCPRFAYGAVSAFIDTFAGAHFDRTLADGDNLHAYAFRSGNNRLVSVFTTGAPAEVTLSGDHGAVEIVDPMGNRRSTAQGQSVTIQAGQYPVTIVFHAAKRGSLRLQTADRRLQTADCSPDKVVLDETAGGHTRRVHGGGWGSHSADRVRSAGWCST